MLKGFTAGAAAIAAAMMASAQAGEEIKCAAQYRIQEQMLLEWAAIGGDPQAQYAVAQCSYPRGGAELSSTEKVNALKWLTLASCEATGVEDHEARDRMTRDLKFGSNISFRRFGGISDDETWTAREKKLIEYRKAQDEDLKDRLDALLKSASVAERDAARARLTEEFGKMGPLGLTRLAEMSSCKLLGASDVFAAAAWSAAADAWASGDLSAVYGDPATRGLDFAKESTNRYGKLSKAEKRELPAVKELIARDGSARVARLESEAALGRIQNLGFAASGPSGLEFTGSATPIAVQYALESLGYIEFVNGPDNDYGPSTIEAAKRAQEAYGRPQTRWLAPQEIRQVVCDAAVKKNDPVSYYHVAMMYADGAGFRKDVSLARDALAKAESLMAERLSDASVLSEWKQRAYPEFAERIAIAGKALAAEASSPTSRHAAPIDGALCQ